MLYGVGLYSSPRTSSGLTELSNPRLLLYCPLLTQRYDLSMDYLFSPGYIRYVVRTTYLSQRKLSHESCFGSAPESLYVGSLAFRTVRKRHTKFNRISSIFIKTIKDFLLYKDRFGLLTQHVMFNWRIPQLQTFSPTFIQRRGPTGLSQLILTSLNEITKESMKSLL